jgi:hypothetical protein
MNQLIKKYVIGNKIVSFEEMTNDFSKIIPINNPIIDTLIIKKLGDYTFKLINHYKWNQSQDLAENILTNVKSMFTPNMIRNNIITKINNIITHEHTNMTSPELINNTIYNMIDTEYKLSENISTREYVDFRFGLRNKLQSVIDNYKPIWNKIEEQFESIDNIIFDNFKDMPQESFNNEIYDFVTTENDISIITLIINYIDSVENSI